MEDPRKHFTASTAVGGTLGTSSTRCLTLLRLELSEVEDYLRHLPLRDIIGPADTVQCEYFWHPTLFDYAKREVAT